jgi:pilus assembly protein Flp/PilA
MNFIASCRAGFPRGRHRQQGAAAIEYALLAALIAVVIVGSVTQTGVSLFALYSDVATQVACATSGIGC